MKTAKYILSGLVIILALTFCSLSLIKAKAQTVNNMRPDCYYTPVKVNLGDTLESIAKEYNTSVLYSDTAYINDLKRINTLYTDIIHPGCYITVMIFE